MRIKHLYLIIVLAATVFTSCTKDNVKPINTATANTDTARVAVTPPATPTITYPVEGKWQQTKLELYSLTPAGQKLYDTTYLQPFNANDYIQFFNNGTCLVGSSHYFYTNYPGNPTIPTPITPSTSNFDYALAGSAYVLKFPPGGAIGPAGFVSADTARTTDKNTLMIHGVTYAIGPNLFVSDRYYTKILANSNQ